MKVALVKYNAGNIQSVIYALQRLGVEPILTDSVDELLAADKVIFPGVGEASSAMASLKAAGLTKVLPALTQPVFGICIGQQLMCAHSEEGNADCLGIFPEQVVRFPATDAAGERYKVPQIGWNTITDRKGPLFEGLPDESYVYFVHSYYCALGPDTMAKTTYAAEFSASLWKDNFYAVQFHPEKSGKVGARILENFLKL